ncbi:endolytic transglycosylase MltG [Saccharobesus litoralis]|uniref:endolytic transglycosylase MltG n=1 Tax=Saccharobesus litoralis TaxID=2172099 RepID=UPI00131EDAF8|nr:endolytic transglycosylase MltG [Saccharobesus litoralis]
MKIKLSTFLKLLAASIFACLTVASVLAFKIASQWQQPAAIHQPLFTIESGWSYYKLIEQLEHSNMIQEPFAFKILVWLNPHLRDIKAGTYRLPEKATQRELVEALVFAKPAEFKITFIEGSRWQDWYAKLQDHSFIQTTLQSSKDEQLKPYYANGRIEGLLFPDTYVFFADTPDINIVEQAYRRMQSVMNQAKQAQQSRGKHVYPLDDYQTLILASIIEKETSIVSEMPLVSSVFHNRLHKKMRLQTDPTVIYGLGDEYQGDITRAHLKQATPYNTYVIKGLPPTPIAMPGKAAIEAAFNPQQSEYYYFVADGKGGHSFSRTLREHNAAVKRYLKLSK